MTIKTLIVDDSATMRALLARMLAAEPDIEVVGEADSALSARAMIRALNPDVITLDIEMPGMSGLEFLEKIMRLRPTAVIVVSGLTHKGAQTTMQALALGAVDCFAKPSDIGGYDNCILPDLIRQASKVTFAQRNETPAATPFASRQSRPFIANGNIVAIGASTGGVDALGKVLAGFPKNCPPTLIVQHIPGSFTQALAAQLDGVTEAKVVEAETDTFLEPGHIYLAPGGERHLMVRASEKPYCRLVSADPVGGHRPSVDVLFRSVATNMGARAVGVLLTGMGADGAAGLLEMRQAGSANIAQNEQTSVVYGMPRAAVELNAADHILPVGRIAERIIDLCRA